MYSDNEADDFYATVIAHRGGDNQYEYHSDNDATGDFAEQTAQQIVKKSFLKPSKNPTHDKKYLGKKTSRRMLANEADEFESADDRKEFSDIDSEGVSEEGDLEKVDGKDVVEFDGEQDWVYDNNDEDVNDWQPSKKRKVDEIDQSNFSTEKFGEEDDTSNMTEKTQSVSLFSEPKAAKDKLGPTSSSSENEKGLAVRKQLELWEKCLQIRILLQKALHAANELPVTDSLKSEVHDDDSDSGFSSDKSDLKEKLYVLLQKLIEMSHISMKGLPVEQNFSSNKVAPGENEEQLDEIGKCLLSEGANLMQLWSEKIQLSSGRFSDKSSSFSGRSNGIPQQIETILADRNRLLKRTRTKRVEYCMRHEEKPEEFFDEYDFYQTLVKDLINSKSSVTNNFSGGNVLDKSDGFKLKNVKSITTQLVRKNRNIVYDIHAKLVGFMAPDNYATDWKNEAIDSLVLSIFDD